MPLRDHFRPPLDDRYSWDMLHGGWPMVIITHMNQWLPQGYAAGPTVHLGGQIEIDLAAYEMDEETPESRESDSGGGGVAVATQPAVYAPPRATLTVQAPIPDPDEYEVRIYDLRGRRRLVAAIEIVSPSNLDRPANRTMFVGKCLALLRQGISVTVIDPVTTSDFNLYAEILGQLDLADPTMPEPPATYAAACRFVLRDRKPVFEAWSQPLAVGSALPTLPLWLGPRLCGPLDLEASYEDACRALRIA